MSSEAGVAFIRGFTVSGEKNLMQALLCHAEKYEADELDTDDPEVVSLTEDLKALPHPEAFGCCSHDAFNGWAGGGAFGWWWTKSKWWKHYEATPEDLKKMRAVLKKHKIETREIENGAFPHLS